MLVVANGSIKNKLTHVLDPHSLLGGIDNIATSLAIFSEERIAFGETVSIDLQMKKRVTRLD